MKAPHFPSIGLYEKALPSDFPLKDKIEQIKKIGFDFLELSIDESSEFLDRLDWEENQRRELRNFSRAANLPIFSLCLSGQRRFPLGSADPSIRQKSREILEKSIQLASDLDVRVMLISGYWVYHEAVSSYSEDFFIEGIAWGASLAARHGVMLGIENIDSDSQINSIRRVVKVIQTSILPG